MLRRFLPYAGATLGLLFITPAVFGVNLTFNPDMGSQMAGCPLMGEAGSICQMNLLEHLAGWHQMLTVRPAAGFGVMALAAALVVVLLKLRFSRRAQDYRPLGWHHIIKTLTVRVRDPVLIALWAGRLHPKVF